MIKLGYWLDILIWEFLLIGLANVALVYPIYHVRTMSGNCVNPH